MRRVTLVFLFFLGLLATSPAQDDFTQVKKQDGAWWVYYHLTQGHGGVLIVKYKYTVIKTGKSITATKELPDGHGVMVGKVNEVTEPVVTGSELKVLITDPAHAK
jgi:hypothetical protein